MTSFSHPIPFVEQVAPFARLCWEMGWNEANGGNISWRLPTEEVESVLARRYPNVAPSEPVKLPQPQPTLDGEYFIVTGTGQYFRHATEYPDQVFGIVKIVDEGTAYQTVWGFNNGGRPTSEFATHLAGHAVRKRVSKGRERIILHCHAPEFIALSFLMPLDSKELTLALWQKMPECIVIFPDGVRVVPPMLPGTTDIADASVKEMEQGRVISWSHHGIFASEENPDKVFGLVETIEKASAMHRKILSCGGQKQSISNELLKELTDYFERLLVCKPDFLDSK
ncbi:rhamnulose-1-phosphate aldolase [uncultured Cohaesibacter sp.]|uniref:rhamnulose-1-phosphate aldolase n=1 Tax=uncultured Cohaesibacter sp. TaxID=1002546 RepID=UPI00292CD94A|nr:rhamnulose-1-phosphate aldolase [uncultured Cohaesibacter sp.]